MYLANPTPFLLALVWPILPQKWVCGAVISFPEKGLQLKSRRRFQTLAKVDAFPNYQSFLDECILVYLDHLYHVWLNTDKQFLAHLQIHQARKSPEKPIYSEHSTVTPELSKQALLAMP